MQNKVTKEHIEYTCDQCSKKKTFIGKPSAEWIRFNFTKEEGLRLLERISDIKRYESLHVPSRKEIAFCSLKCAHDFTHFECKLFLAEIQKKVLPKGFKPKRTKL